ncbi:hypothetical protein SAMD00019534_036650 [Acytostelium subglobosum LB1]|uniref:hypothetical protein n=1 Tax=Acytostelium subglobosum LB1 TaxID=1410327 RepID=UPI000644C9DE|nr:hypothetical protein SAMD00019534_036650 [Acytostelium subglobosum LB1]GAM20490.1 hypothetical protein SAMD00019534_036650 [Acytostelium subglobosum LB1]|eukprot:XP_012760011.1 hypothetical protein SAMD00019534_036650 [Acytostelium subglobosum LB1]
MAMDYTTTSPSPIHYHTVDPTNMDIEKFFAKLKSHNIRPIVFFDGITPEYKYKEIISRFKDKLRKTRESARTLKVHDHQHVSKWDRVPALMIIQFKSAMERMGIECRTTVEEADQDIVQWSLDNKAYGILSSDTDYFFFEFLGNIMYFPMSEWKMDGPGIQAGGYLVSNVAQALRVNEMILPIVATLIGNDHTKQLQTKYNNAERDKDRILTRCRSIKTRDPDRKVYIEHYLRGLRLSDKEYEDFLDDLKMCDESIRFYRDPSPIVKLPSNNNNNNNILSKADFLKLKPYFTRFFGNGDGGGCSLVNYIYLTPLISKTSQLSVNSIAPATPGGLTITHHTASIRHRMFGLVDKSSTVTGKRYFEVVPTAKPKGYNDSCHGEGFEPILTSFGVDQCWDGTVDMSDRVKEFCLMFGTTEAKALEYSAGYLPGFKTKRSFDDLMLILFCQFFNEKSLVMDIKNWMVDTWLFSYLLIGCGRNNFDSMENIRYQPMQLTELISYLYSLAYPAIELLNIIGQFPIKAPHQVMDIITLHMLWDVAEQAWNKSQQHQDLDTTTQQQQHTLQMLFSQSQFSGLIDEYIITEFDRLKQEIGQVCSTITVWRWQQLQQQQQQQQT